jgi:4-alpha-glucanotransferase
VASHGSPYSPHSLFAGNPLLLSPERLLEDGHIQELPDVSVESGQTSVDYEAALAFKDVLVGKAFKNGYPRIKNEGSFTEFREKNSGWLDDFALYDALKKETGAPWYAWPAELRNRSPAAMVEIKSALAEAIDRAVFSQFLFEEQWSSLASRAKELGIRILGDVPFYVLYDSADVWAHRDLFKVNAEGKPVFVGGVPPDYFSKDGQRWGNPVYDWGKMEEHGYSWWNSRVARCLQLADFLRLDHFRGYVAYWEIPAEEPTARNGSWVATPKSFLGSVRRSFPSLPFVAEDLGVITDDVKAAVEKLGIPGMRVLQFAFDGKEDNPHLPGNQPRNSLVFTGTHDTNTVLGWFIEEAGSKEKRALEGYLGREVTEENVCAVFAEMAMSSASELCIFPLQDLLGLGSESRMNNPGKSMGNWRWRATPQQLSEAVFRRLAEATAAHSRG